jgi:hypothetical protein
VTVTLIHLRSICSLRLEYTGLRSNESFLLCVQDVLHATTRKRVLDSSNRSSLVCFISDS